MPTDPNAGLDADALDLEAPETLHLWCGPQWRAVEADTLPWSAWPSADPNGGSVEYVRAAALRASRAEVERLRAALEEIARGEGPFSRDQLTFAEGVIEQSKRLARAALGGNDGK